MTRSWPARPMAASPWAAIRTLDRWVRAVRGSPRFNRALPPRAATTSMSGSQGGDQHRLDGVHAVFRLIKNDRGGAFENLVRDFHGVDTEFLLNLLTNRRLGVVEGRQAVHEVRPRIAGFFHKCGSDLIRQQQLDPLGPFF